ncbi:MAG: DNA polymerase IV [Rhizobiales bacterium 65-9]|nr:DNA polymerase IV [Hyphomicrobiales bacterium]OJY34002.1 MAG: DNA polymerase IV [Rhizobiales bacterium 65-9]
MARFLCRDCLRDAESDAARRCPVCGGPRLLSHPERDLLTIAHVDCDAFYATIEKRDDPALRNRPVIVGGGKRGVVSTACYIARTYGVRSAMPMFKALDACPDAVVIKPDMEKYVAVGREVRRMMQELTPLVQPLSIDEAFLDLSGTQDLHRAPPAFVLADFARRVEKEIGITLSVGLSHNKFLAKIASDLDKPRGFSIVGRAETLDFLADKPLSILPGVGRAAAARYERAGLRRIADLRERDAASLLRDLGNDGLRLRALANGIDERRVTPDREAKTISAETTFNEDIADMATLVPLLMRLSEKVAARLRKQDLAGRSVTLKLKTAQFELRTRTRGGLAPTQLSMRIFEVARDLLGREIDGVKFRLIGVGAGDLAPGSDADKGDLVDVGVAREVARETAIDRLREKFGSDAIQRGAVFDSRRR